MVYDDWLPSALTYGVPYKLFFHLSPKRFEAFGKAYRRKIEEQDELAHLQGRYFLEALIVALSKAFSKGSQAEYPKKPYSQMNNEDKKIEVDEHGEKLLPKEERIKKVQAIFAELERQKINYNLRKQQEEQVKPTDTKH